MGDGLDDDDTLSDTDVDEPSDISNVISTPTHPSAVLIKNSATTQTDDDNVTVDTAKIPVSGSHPLKTSHKRGREDDEEGEEKVGGDGSDEVKQVKKEDEEDGNNEDDNPKSSNGKKTCCGDRKYRKMVHSHSCSISCGESMRIDE